MPLPDDYLAALERLAATFASYKEATGSEAILVGGAAVAILTAGLFLSGDFDVIAGQDDQFAEAMRAHGFKRENRPGHLHMGWFHDDHPCYGFQQVSGRLFDGLADHDRLLHVPAEPAGVIVLPSVEDMVADRLAQHATRPPTDDSRLQQALAMVRLANAIDRDYLYRRVEAEGGDPSLLTAAFPSESGL